MTRSCTARAAITATTLLLAMACGPAPPDEATGAELYAVHCVSCHGPAGAGDGPVAAELATPPVDLRGLAARNGGVFDEAAVLGVIDGRRAVAVHGPREMPVWGRRLVEERRDDSMPFWRAMGDARALVDHLRTLQDAPQGGP